MNKTRVTVISAGVSTVFGGLAGGVRDENLLMAALGRPLHKWHYDDPKPDIFILAAAYCFALVKGHAFHDGNKRIAYIVTTDFLELNGQICAPRQDDIVTTMLSAAVGSVSEEQLAIWFKRNIVI